VFPGPFGVQTLARLRSLDLPIRFIQGNGERAVLERRAGAPATPLPEAFEGMLKWMAAQLSDEGAQFISSWPPMLRLEVQDVGEVLFVHATPRNDEEIFTRNTPEERLLPIFDTTGANVVVCGHTHMQFDRMIGGTRVVNAGSVGMSFAGPGAHWLLLGPRVELRHTSYDVEAAAALIRRTTYPQAEDFAANNVLRTPTEETMLTHFASYELA
jgi:diadenosine tetraphosphatase ApaH/serine/threonine PP2A family protein phosphatase